MKIFSLITSLFVEKKCYACGQVWHFFCPQCNASLQKYTPYCYVCKQPSPDFKIHRHCQKDFPFQQVIVLTHYKYPVIKKLLQHAKYYGKHQIYTDLILQNSDFLRKYMQPHGIFIPVPMYFLRQWKRGYNQSEKIAKLLARLWDGRLDTTRVYKKKYTKHQSHLSAELRHTNIRNSFSAGKKFTQKGVKLYIVDDVISTGSTLWEIAKIFKKQGLTDIRAVVIASD